MSQNFIYFNISTFTLHSVQMQFKRFCLINKMVLPTQKLDQKWKSKQRNPNITMNCDNFETILFMRKSSQFQMPIYGACVFFRL